MSLFAGSIVTFNYRFCNDIFVFAKSITSPPSSNILNFLPNPFPKLLQQIHLANHKLLHKLIRLFQLILQASVLLPEHLILISQFRKMVEYWARLRDKLEDGEISETEYYLKEVKYPMNPTDPNKEYTVSLNLDDDDQLLVQNMDEYDDAEETAELLKDLFPDFSYVKRKRKPKKE